MENKKSRTQIKLPDNVNHIISVLNDAGYEAYAVGGCVRDSILGRNPLDYDITTSAKPEEIKRLFRRTVDTGIKHGTVTVLIKDDSYEVTTYRIDGSYEDARHPKEVIFTEELVEDLRRRDFTINAMAYSDNTGLIDEFDGLKHLEEGIIKAVGNPFDRMSEDALRIMRAVRFSAQLNYDIEEETKSAIRKLACNLDKISAERICTELVKLLTSDHPEKIRDAYELGITKVILPEFDIMMPFEQNTRHHMYTVGEHTINTLINVNKERDRFSEKENRYIKLAMLFHDMGKVYCRTIDEKTGQDHFKGHPEKSEEIALSIMRRLKLDNETIANVRILVRYHDYRPKLTMPRVRESIVRIGKERMKMLFAINRADTLSQSLYEREEKLGYIQEYESKYDKVIEDGDPISLKDLAVSGKDLIENGFRPGKELGDVLDALFKVVIDVPEHNTKEYLLDYSKRFITEQ